MNLQLHCARKDGYDGVEVHVCASGFAHTFFIAKGEPFFRTAYARLFSALSAAAETGELDHAYLDGISVAFTCDTYDFEGFFDKKGNVR